MNFLLGDDVGLLGENHHKVNLLAGESLLLNEGPLVPLLWITSYIASLNGQILD